MFSVTLRDGLLLLGILLGLIGGAMVKHWRDSRRERPQPVLTTPAAPPHPGSHL